MFFAVKQAMKLNLFWTVILLAFLPAFVLASPEKEVILGIGGGYSLCPEEAARHWRLDWAPGQIYFEEHLQLTYSLNLNIQYFFNKDIGVKLEYQYQRGSYFSHLEWYSEWQPDPMGGIIYLDIDHIEEPNTQPWSISSISVSLVAAQRRFLERRQFPYGFVGAGFYVLGGDRELVLDRIRLGPSRTGWLMKIGGGIKYRLSRSLRLNVRIYGEAIWNQSAYSRGTGSLYAGTLQFSSRVYFDEGRIVREVRALVRSFVYLGIDLSLEFTLPSKKKNPSF
jgi:hypothetical protein